MVSAIEPKLEAATHAGDSPSIGYLESNGKLKEAVLEWISRPNCSHLCKRFYFPEPWKAVELGSF